jgi:hypothetical protein
MPDVGVLVRPLRVKQEFVRRSYAEAVGFFVVAAVAAIGFPLFGLVEARAIRRDHDLWKRGAVAAEVTVPGSATTHVLIVTTYELDVGYRDQAGTAHRGRAELTTLFAPLPNVAPVAVRYDPQAPDRFVLSWAVEFTSARWQACSVLLVAGVAFGVLFRQLGRRALVRLADARAAAIESEDVELEVAGMDTLKEWNRSTGQVKYQYLVPIDGGKPKKRQVTFNRRKQHTPIFIDEKRTRLLAVRTPKAPDRPIVLRSDCYPFDVPEWDRQTVTTRLQRRRGDA